MYSKSTLYRTLGVQHTNMRKNIRSPDLYRESVLFPGACSERNVRKTAHCQKISVNHIFLKVYITIHIPLCNYLTSKPEWVVPVL